MRPPEPGSLSVIILTCPLIGSLSSSTVNQRAAQNNYRALGLQDLYFLNVVTCTGFMPIEETFEEVTLAFVISPIFENRQLLIQVVVVSLDLKIEPGLCQFQMLSNILLTPCKKTLKLTVKCFKFVQILSFMANRGPMPILHVILALMSYMIQKNSLKT